MKRVWWGVRPGGVRHGQGGSAGAHLQPTAPQPGPTARLAGDHGRRKVPGRDGAHHAHRLHRGREGAFSGRDRPRRPSSTPATRQPSTTQPVLADACLMASTRLPLTVGCRTSPSTLWASAAHHATDAAADASSLRASASGLPASRAMMAATSSVASTMASCQRMSTAARSLAVRARQPGSAAAASPTATRVSAAPARG